MSLIELRRLTGTRACASSWTTVPVERRVETQAVPSSWCTLGEEAPAFRSARMSVHDAGANQTDVGGLRLSTLGRHGGEWSNEGVFAAVACAANHAFE